MRLSELVFELKVKYIIPPVGDGPVDPDVTGFSMDSRSIKPGEMFTALTEPDLKDRLLYLPAAVEAGASCLLTEVPQVDLPIPQVVVPDTKVASAVLAATYYDHPENAFTLIGVTGTKGKTSTTYFIEQVLQQIGVKAGLLGTTGAYVQGGILEPTNTTPHPINLYRLLETFRNKGCTTVAMEASSHALKLNRISGLVFHVGVFTNIGHDHIDLHKTVEDYVKSKARLMSRVKGLAVVNADDEWAGLMMEAASCEVLTYGFNEGATLRAVDVRRIPTGTAFRVVGPLGEYEVKTRLIGKFNVYNALAALGAVVGVGVPMADAVRCLEEAGGVPGRVESVDTQGLGFQVVVDYAHTSESLESVLSTLKSVEPRRLISVFGCGGDRDRTKRPIMGAISGRIADYSIVTSDNPRTEDPASILEEIRVGLEDAGIPLHKYEVAMDRREAIRKAITMAEPGDIVAVCGKGHETGQIIGNEKLPFDDREEAALAIAIKAAGK